MSTEAPIAATLPAADTVRRRDPSSPIRWARRAAVLMLIAIGLAWLPLNGVAVAQDTPRDADTAHIGNDSTGTIPVPSFDGVGSDTAAAAVRYDSSDVRLRSPDAATLRSYRSDRDFAYDRVDQEAPESLLERFFRWIFDSMTSTLGVEGTSTALDIVQYVVILLALVVIVSMITKTDVRTFFRRSAQPMTTMMMEQRENIHEMDFDALIAEAVNAHDYRRAIRLQYLKQIRRLSDHELIAWRIDKTNRDFLHELKRDDLRGAFADITLLFEYAWYGDAPVNSSLYHRARERFDAFGMHVEARA